MSETATMTLTEFLLARIAEGEAAARAAKRCASCDDPEGHGAWYHHSELMARFDGARSDVEHIARHYPDRVLAECEAKRGVVEHLAAAIAAADRDSRYEGTTACANMAEDLLEILALPYADHPDYDEEWKP